MTVAAFAGPRRAIATPLRATPPIARRAIPAAMSLPALHFNSGAAIGTNSAAPGFCGERNGAWSRGRQQQMAARLYRLPMTTACSSTRSKRSWSVAAQPEPEADQPADEQATEEVVIESSRFEEPVEEPVKKPAKAAKAKAKAKGKLEPGTQAWNNACDQRYRSFNPKTGIYKSLSGKRRKCQL